MLSRLSVAIALFVTATAAQAQWGTPTPQSPPPAASMNMAAMSGHLFTVSVPYSFNKLQPAVEKVAVSCRVTIVVTSQRSQAPVKRLELTPQNGQLSGTAVFTWDKSDFDPMADLSQQHVPADCWFDLKIQGVANWISYQPPPGIHHTPTIAPSQEPAAQHDPNAPFRTNVAENMP